MGTEQQAKTMSVGAASTQTGVGPATSSDLIRLAVAYNDALDRCTQTGGANIDEVMDLLAEDATWTLVGGESHVGKTAIRAGYLRRTERYQQVGELKGIDLWGDLVVCRGERRDTTLVQAGGEPQLRILLVKGGKIKQVIVVVDPELYARMRSDATE